MSKMLSEESDDETSPQPPLQNNKQDVEKVKNVEDFIQGNVIELNNPTSNVTSLSENDLQKMKYDELRALLKNVYNVTMSKGNKVNLVEKVLELQSK